MPIHSNSTDHQNHTGDAAVNVICLGNPLHGNDGFGSELFKRLNTLSLPANVRVIDGGTGGLLLLPFFKNCSRVILVDLIINQEKSFEILQIPNFSSEYKILRQASFAAAEHGGDLVNLMQYLPVLLEAVPQVDLIAMSTSEIDYYSPELDQEIIAMMPTILDAILKQLPKVKGTPLRH